MEELTSYWQLQLRGIRCGCMGPGLQARSKQDFLKQDLIPGGQVPIWITTLLLVAAGLHVTF